MLFSTTAWTFAARISKFTGHFGWGMMLLSSLDLFDNNTSLDFEKNKFYRWNIFLSCLPPPHPTPALIKKPKRKIWCGIPGIFGIVIILFLCQYPCPWCNGDKKKYQCCILFSQQTKERYKQGSGGVTELTKSLSQVCLV